MQGTGFVRFDTAITELQSGKSVMVSTANVPKCTELLLIAVFITALFSAGELAAQEAVPNPRVKDTSFVSRHDGSTQQYVVVLPPQFRPEKPVSVLFALHGHGSDRWQFVTQDRGECRAARDAAAAHGMLFVSPDYRAKTSWMGPAATADMIQIIDELHQNYRVDRIIVSGGSMGGTAALALTAMHPELIDGVVCLNGTANMLEYEGFSEAIAAAYGGKKSETEETYRVRSAELFPEKFSMPVAFTSGGKDTLVPPASVLRLAESIQKHHSACLLLHRADGGHDTNYEDSMKAFEFVLEKSVGPVEKQSATSLVPANSPFRIVCLGDSVTGVYYHTGGLRAYPEMLQAALRTVVPGNDITVINAGISGHTAADGIARLERDVLAYDPQLVTISFGLNDMTRFSIDQFRSNLQELVTRIRGKNSQVVLCTPNAVIDTASRPVQKLKDYCDCIRELGQAMSVPVCDQFSAGERLRIRAPWTWRLTLSDEIHPNMDGHKRMAEELCRTISGDTVSLDSFGPIGPKLRHTRKLIADGKPIKILAMSPVSAVFVDCLKTAIPGAVVELTEWQTEGKSVQQLEQEAQSMVRSMKPDLVVLTLKPEAIAASATSDSSGKFDWDAEQSYVKSASWIMNWSLSFGLQEWDCIVIHPAVTAPASASGSDSFRSGLIRQLVHAQDLFLIDRTAGNERSAREIILEWLNTEEPVR